MTPLQIEILLHYWYSSSDYPNLDSPDIFDAINEFCHHGILIQHNVADANNPVFYGANREGLEVYIKTICAVPLPANKWVIENVKEQH